MPQQRCFFSSFEKPTKTSGHSCQMMMKNRCLITIYHQSEPILGCTKNECKTKAVVFCHPLITPKAADSDLLLTYVIREPYIWSWAKLTPFTDSCVRSPLQINNFPRHRTQRHLYGNQNVHNLLIRATKCWRFNGMYCFLTRFSARRENQTTIKCWSNGAWWVTSTGRLRTT